MSIMRCESCERFVDTDFEEMHDIGNQRRLERWVCEFCAEQWHDKQEAEPGPMECISKKCMSPKFCANPNVRCALV